MNNKLFGTIAVAFMAIMLLPVFGVAEQTKTVYNAFTSKLDYITAITTNTIVPGSGVTVTCTNGACTISSSGGGGGGGGYVGFYLKDSALNTWSITVNSSGNLITTPAGSSTTGTLYRTSFGMKDSTGAVWMISINTSGNLITSSGGDYSQAVNDVLINDSNNFTWIVSVNTSGNLITS